MPTIHRLLRYGKPRKGETLFVSAASGSVGQLVCQMGRLLGLRVVGTASSDEKLTYLRQTVDGVINYKTEDVDARLSELCPDGIDIYYDNVGGHMLDHALNHANSFCRYVMYKSQMAHVTLGLDIDSISCIC